MRLPRLDRLATVYLFAPLLRRAGRSAAVPVLMYHGISDEPEESPPYYRTRTAPAVFRSHLRHLKAQGYASADLDDLPGLLSREGSVSVPRVVITFDDGFRDFHTCAFPALREYGFNATMFLPTGFIQARRRSFKGRDCLTWSEVRELREQGVHFGSHTVQHPRLHGMSWPDIQCELRDSKASLEDNLSEPVTTFAYPFAYPAADPDFVQRFEALLEDTGYVCNVTTLIGRVRSGDNVFRLPRLPINSCDDLELFAAKLQGGYDWLETPQLLAKRCKSWLRRPCPPSPPLGERAG
jgi:peptidoglycan/xylan/chitin deacetylase (PgdA/CDA1 family)